MAALRRPIAVSRDPMEHQLPYIPVDVPPSAGPQISSVYHRLNLLCGLAHQYAVTVPQLARFYVSELRELAVKNGIGMFFALW